MYIWTKSTPARDSSFDKGVVFHEYGHGLSNRLTGGPKNSGCLGYGESGGMGEGWSDVLGTITRFTNESNRFDPIAKGDYIANKTTGIRKFPVRVALYPIFVLFAPTKDRYLRSVRYFRCN
jgi:extracellular elastinolytic metalloproteinase